MPGVTTIIYGRQLIAMATRQEKRSRLQLRGAQGIFHVFVITLAVGLLLFQLFSSVVVAFSESYWVGSRSLAAAIFPISVAVYIHFLARPQVPVNASYAPVINNYVIFLLWTVLIIGIDSSYDFIAFPVQELAYACTLALMIARYKRQESVKDLLACCYGILSGALAAVVIFGWNPFML
jgi:hypothetical protein